MNGQTVETTSQLHIKAWIPLILVVAGWLVYCNNLNTPFIFDDIAHIERDSSIRNLSQLGQVLGDSNRPIIKLSLAINYAIGGVNVFGYHITNIVIHILAALVLYGIIRRALLSNRLRDRYGCSAPWVALAASLIWLVHPLQTQTVTYTIQRSESLMGLFYLLTLYCVIRSTEEHRTLWSIVAVAACALGMGTKEVMVTAPFSVLLYDCVFLSRSPYEAVRRRWGLYLGLAATWGIVFGLVGEQLITNQTSAGFGMQAITKWQYVRTQSGVILHYLRLAFWPYPLVLDYWWQVDLLPRDFVPKGLVIAGPIVASIWGMSRRSPFGFLGMWFFLLLAPTSSIMPIFDLAFEHRMYLSLAAVVVLTVVLVHHWLTWVSAPQWIAPTILAVVVAALGARTLARNLDYASVIDMWRQVSNIRMDNPRAHTSLGVLLAAKDQDDEAMWHLRWAVQIRPDYPIARASLGNALQKQGDLDEAIVQYEEALRFKQDYADAHFNLAVALESNGDQDRAIEHYRKTIEIRQDHGEANNNLGAILASQDRYDQAISHFRQAIKFDPKVAESHTNLGRALQHHKKYDEAIVYFRNALALDATNALIHQYLASVLHELKQTDEALDHYRKSIAINPDRAEAHFFLGLELYADRNPEEAAECYQQALKLNPNYPKAHNNLALVLESQGKIGEAMTHYHRAIELQPDYAIAHNNLATNLWEQHRRSEAITHFRKAIEADPKYVKAHYNLAQALLLLGDRDGAIEQSQIAVSLNPRMAGIIKRTLKLEVTAPMSPQQFPDK